MRKEEYGSKPKSVIEQVKFNENRKMPKFVSVDTGNPVVQTNI